MSNNPTYPYNGQDANSPSSNQNSSQRMAPHSSATNPQGYPYPQSIVPQPSSTYPYYQQPQNYGHATQLQPNAPVPAASQSAYQGYPALSGHANVSQTSTVAHHSHPAYARTPTQSAYAGYEGASYPQASPQQYAQYPERGQGAPPSTYAHQRHNSSSTITPSSSLSQSPQSSSPDRYPCPHCEKTFTRNFDRKRHMEIHLPGSSGSNRCRHCYKDYSRSDSLKRHLDNGCEKKPSA